MKKGFTLIELLAVIVILAVIALIATPIILNIINDSREQAGIRGAELYIDAAKLAIVKANMTGEVTAETCTVLQTGNLSCGGTEIQVDMNGTTATAGTITFTNGKITSVTGLVMGDATYGTDSNGKIVKGDTIAHVPFTGTIYRVSDEPISIGDSIVPRTESVICIHVYVNNEFIENSCNSGYYLNSMEECNEEVSEYGAEDVTYVCETGTVQLGLTNYQTESPLTHSFTKSAYCVVDENSNYNSCVNDNFGYVRQTICNDSSVFDSPMVCTTGTINPNYYLKHEVENDIIQSSYVCMKYVDNGATKELCLQGGDQSYYGTYDGISPVDQPDVRDKNPTGNIALLAAEVNYFDSTQEVGRKGCRFNRSYSVCDNTIISISSWFYNVGTYVDNYANNSAIHASAGCSIDHELSYCN